MRTRHYKQKTVWSETGGVCHWCGIQTVKNPSGTGIQVYNTFTVDHVIPVSQGGTNDRENLVAACYACNQKRNEVDVLNLKELWVEL